ncbi:hypothetical protein L6R50_15880 [Myxococcota bacterium]|nr:hypothetical protein [Myxococcota bacterium]
MSPCRRAPPWVLLALGLLACRTAPPAPDAASPGAPPADAPGDEAPDPPDPRAPRAEPAAAGGPTGDAPVAPAADAPPRVRDPAASLPGTMPIRSEEVLQPGFPTGDATLVRQIGTCMPIQACTFLVARRAGQEDQRISEVAQLSALVPEIRSEVEALAFASFLTRNRASFRDFHCEQAVIRGDRFDRWRLPDDVRPDATRVTTATLGEGGPYVVTRYLGCYTESGPDRLILTKEEVSATGDYALAEAELVHEGTFLPRYR